MDNNYIQMIISAKGSDLDSLQIAIRALILFIYTLILFRVAKKRFLGKSTPFDYIMGVVLGSVISRAINGSATVLPTMVVGVVFLLFHWLLSYASVRSSFMSRILEGIPVTLMKNGAADKEAMSKSHIRFRDILEASRSTAHVHTLDKIADAFLENSGKISVIPKEKKEKP